MKRNSKINLGNSLPNLRAGRLNRPTLQISLDKTPEIPIQANELELLDDQFNEIIAYVAKNIEIESE